MNPFLDLLNELVVSAYAVRELIDGRAAIQRMLEEKLEDLSDDDFAKYKARCEAIDAQLQRSNRVEDRRSQLTALGSAPQPSQVTRSVPAGLTRGPDPRPRSQDPNDPLGGGAHRFSISRAVACVLAHRPLDGFEREASDEVAMQRGQAPRSFYIPTPVADDPGRIQRSTVTTTVGSSLNQTTVMPTLIDILRNRSAFAQFSPTVFTGLVGNHSIPTQTGANTAYWVAEGSDVTDSNATFSSISLTPNSLGGTTTHTRKFLLQQNIVTENWLQNELARVMALEIDRAIANGSGSGAQPYGILQKSGIDTVAIGTDGGALTWAKIVELETAVANDNADVGQLGYITNSKVRGAAKTILQFSSAGSTTLFQPGANGSGTMNGYNCVVSNQIPSTLTKGSSSGVCSALIFGNFADLIQAFWSGVDVLVNPYTGDMSGNVRITAFVDTDIKFRRDESFQKIVDITT